MGHKRNPSMTISLMADTSHIPKEVLDHFTYAKHNVLAWNSVFLVIPSILAWGEGHTYFSLIIFCEAVVAAIYWSTWKRDHVLRLVDIVGSNALLLISFILCTGKQPDPVSAMIWWGMCYCLICFWYFLSLSALRWDTASRHVHGLHYHFNFRAPMLTSSIFVVSETTWDQFTLYCTATILLMQFVVFYALDMNWVHYRAYLSVSFPFTYLWCVVLYVALYFHFFANENEERATTFSLYFTAGLFTVMALVALHYLFFRLLLPRLPIRRNGASLIPHKINGAPVPEKKRD